MRGTIRTWITALFVAGTPFVVDAAALGEDSSAAREMAAQVQTAWPAPGITPRDARQEFVRVPMAGGKGTLSLPVKGGQLNVLLKQGAVAVGLPDEDASHTPQAAPLPKEGFSAPLVVNLEYADKTAGIASLSFARGEKEGDLFVRNMAVAVARVGGAVVYVFDDNCNGKYNDAGEDAILSDGGQLAVKLGSTAMIGGAACSVQMSENGTKLSVAHSPGKVGAATLTSSVRDGWGHLAGVVVKGAGGEFALRPDQYSILPAGSYELSYAVLRDAGDRRALVSGGKLKLTVPEAGQAMLPSLGHVKLDMQAQFDAKTGRIVVQPPKPESVSCAGGGITYFFPLPAPDVHVLGPGRTGNGREQIIYSAKMPLKGGPLSFGAGDAGMRLFEKYKMDMIWLVGVGPDPKGTTEVETNLPAPPKKEKDKDKKK